MGCYSPLKGYKDRLTGGLTFSRDNAIETMDVACGQCLGCRTDYSLEWAVRISHEASLYDENCFITLTYRDRKACTINQLHEGYHVPDDWSLHPRHFQLFMKRLRKFFSDRTIRVFYAGEYGRKCKHNIDVTQGDGCPLCNLGRPHFHACVFNLNFPDLESYASDDGELRYTSRILQSIWKYGFVDVGELTFGSAAYTARYILKKITGIRAYDHYYNTDLDGNVVMLEPEFCKMSNGGRAGKGEKSGIGAKWFAEYRDDVFPKDRVPYGNGEYLNKVPRYYEEIYKEIKPESLAAIKKKRADYKRKNQLEFSPQRLEDKYKCHKARLELRRGRIL
jgi:hypothetical protein